MAVNITTHVRHYSYPNIEAKHLPLSLHASQEHNIRYCALDFSHLSKHRDMNVLKALEEVAAWTVGQVGFFCRCEWLVSVAWCYMC